MSNLWPALIAFLGVLVANFLGEDYKRFRDGQALAGALLGEIQTFSQQIIAMIKLYEDFDTFLLSYNLPRTEPIPWETLPKEVRTPIFRENGIYEANLGKIGLLGPDIAHLVVSVYGMLSENRTACIMLYKLKFTHDQLSYTKDRAEEAKREGDRCCDYLRQFADAQYVPSILKIFSKAIGQLG